MNKIIVVIFFLCIAQLSYSQIRKPTKSNNPTKPPSTQTQTVNTVEGITSKMLELISGPKGQERNWDEFRMLFIPRAQMVLINPEAPKGRQVQSMNIEEFMRSVGPLYSKDGFEESVIGQSIDEFNGIAQVFQSFYCKNLVGTYEERGINSYQLVYADDRWWITSLTFTNETTSKPIPEKYLFTASEQKKNESENPKKVKYKLPKGNSPFKNK